MRALVFIFIILLSTNAHAWTEADTKMEATYLTLHLIDWQQTREIVKNPEYTERNNIIGNNTSEVDRYYLLTGVGHILISALLPENPRFLWQTMTIGLEVFMVGNNLCMGVGLGF